MKTLFSPRPQTERGKFNTGGCGRYRSGQRSHSDDGCQSSDITGGTDTQEDGMKKQKSEALQEEIAVLMNWWLNYEVESQ